MLYLKLPQGKARPLSPSTASRQGKAVRYLLFLCLCACVHGPLPSAQDGVAGGIVQEPMSRFAVGRHEVLFPKSLQRQAFRIGRALKNCRPRLSLGTHEAKLRLILIHPGFENAYMESGPTWPDTIVMPVNLLRSGVRLAGLSPSLLGPVACHEAIHARQFAQRGGAWRLLERATGFKINTQGSTESWFIEGLGTAFEEGHGRPWSRLDGAYWRGAFEAHLAHHGTPDTSVLSPYYPPLVEFGGDYVSGGYFVRWLVENFGWSAVQGFVESQGAALLPILGTGLRFRQHFKAPVNLLFRRFYSQWRQRHPIRTRPKDQQVLVDRVGLFARLSRSPRSGLFAMYRKGLDQSAHLDLVDINGRVIASRSVGAFAGWGEPRAELPRNVDGFEFGRDGSLYMTILLPNPNGRAANILFRLDGSSLKTTGRWSLARGASGGAHPMGRTYVFVRYEGGDSWLSQLNLETKEQVDLWSFKDTSPPLSPAFSPDGERIVFVRGRADGRQQLWLFDLIQKSQRPVSIPFQILHNPRFISQQKVMMACEFEGRIQACIHRLDRDETLVLSKAPYGVLDPQHQRPRGLAFLNRTAAGWSLDQVEDRRVQQRFPFTPEAVSGQFFRPASLSSRETESVSWYQGLFLPRFWLPVVSGGSRAQEAWRLGLWLGGSSDLLLHSYYLLGTVDTGGDEPSLEVFIQGRRWAPWQTTLGLALDQDGLQGNWGLERALGSFWGIQAKATGLRLRDGRTFLAGPRARVQYRVRERTGRGVVRRALFWDLQAAWFPPLGDNAPLLDGRFELAVTLPSLLSPRQNISTFARWRELVGAPASSLRVGGGLVSDSLSLSLPERSWELYRFQERMTGYEDQSLPGRRFALAGLDFRHRFPLHFGRLYPGMLLPSLYFRHAEFSVYGRYGQLDSDRHRTIGFEAALALASGGRTPWTLFARGSWRFDVPDQPYFQLGLRY